MILGIPSYTHVIGSAFEDMYRICQRLRRKVMLSNLSGSKIAWPIACGCLALFSALSGAATECPQTFCNPLNLDYRFQLDNPVRREAADTGTRRISIIGRS